MKKLILLVVAVSCLGFTQAQKVTKIFITGEGENNWELKGDTIFYQKQLYNLSFSLSFEFENGEKELNAGDSVIIKGSFTSQTYEDAESPYTIDGIAHRGFLFIVPSGGLAPNETCRFTDPYKQPVSSSGVAGNGETDGTAKCDYASGYGDLSTPPAPDVRGKFYLIRSTESVLESAIAAVKVFPTLASDEIQVTNLANTDVAIYSLVGQRMLVHSNLTGNVSIDVSSLANGLYFVKMQNGSAVRTEKIKIVR